MEDHPSTGAAPPRPKAGRPTSGLPDHRREGSGSAVARPAPRPLDQDSEASAAPAPDRRAFARRALFAVLAAAALATGIRYWLFARSHEDTDDAQVDADMVAVSSRVPGTVTATYVVDNQRVRKGDLVLELDPTDLKVALAQARAAVAQAEAQIASDTPSVSITEVTNRSAVEQTQADVEAVRTDLEASQRKLEEAQAEERLAQIQLDRARGLLAESSIARADFDERVTAHEVAVATVAAAEQGLFGHKARLKAALSRQKEVSKNAPGQLASRQAFVEARHANLELARAQLQQAELNLGYARVLAPEDGIVGHKGVNPGERVEPGQTLFVLSRTDNLWVTADFRETQVRRMRTGQPAEIHVDALGRDFRGHVESFGGATGSRFSLLPPENASGNYVKVVQRLPVRLRFEPGQDDLDKLRPGMSVEPTVALR